MGIFSGRHFPREVILWAVRRSPAGTRLAGQVLAGGRNLYRAITAGGKTLDFYLSPKQNVAAAKRFLAKTLRSNASAGYPRVINMDKAPSLAKAITSAEVGRGLPTDSRAPADGIPQQRR